MRIELKPTESKRIQEIAEDIWRGGNRFLCTLSNYNGSCAFRVWGGEIRNLVINENGRVDCEANEAQGLRLMCHISGGSDMLALNEACAPFTTGMNRVQHVTGTYKWVK